MNRPRFKPLVVLWYWRIAFSVVVFGIPLIAGRTVSQALVVVCIVALSPLFLMFSPLFLVFGGWIGLYEKPSNDGHGDDALFSTIGVIGALLLTGIVTLILD